MYTGFQFLFKIRNIADLFSERFLGKRFVVRPFFLIGRKGFRIIQGCRVGTVLSQEMGEGAFGRGDGIFQMRGNGR